MKGDKMDKITREIAKRCVGKGWENLIDDIYDSMPNEVIVNQVKEKFGTLRFYYSYGNGVFDDIVSLAERMSGEICEDCGGFGKNEQRGGWYRTLCKGCAEKELRR
jgi:hypothetical protein